MSKLGFYKDLLALRAGFLLRGQWEGYRGRGRVAVHIAFWIIIALYVTFRVSFSQKKFDGVFVLITLRELLTIVAVHYFVAYHVIPKLLLRARWKLLVLSLAATYVFLVTSHYYSLYFLRKFNQVPAFNVEFVNFYLTYDLPRTLVDPVRMYNTILFYSTLFFTLLIKTTKSFLMSNIERLKLEKDKIKLEKENLNLELNFLKAQINPHFLFNTLNNIYSLIVDKDDLAADIILRLSNLMRYSLYESNNPKILLRRELQFLNDYVELEKIRHQDYVQINMTIEGDPGLLEIPPLVIITFVENAFKHGVKNTASACWVNIRVVIRGDELSFSIHNSKPAKLSHETVQGGIGLINVRRRLDLTFPGKYELSIKNKPDTYLLHLHVQFDEQGSEMHHRGRRAVSAGSH